MKIKERFSDQDLQRIKTAVKDAENSISGEIVPVIVERSGQYMTANYKAAIVGGSLAFILMIILDRYIISDYSNTLFYDPVFIFFVVILGGLVGGLLPNFVEGLKRQLVGQVQLDQVTRQRAETAFLEEEVFNTKHRTGIMIFISFFEHEVIVMADRGISKVVEQKQWDKIVADLVGQIRDGKIVEGLEAGIKRCGEILLEKGFHKADDDVNELSDDLRID
ncbi:putative membrane protein [Chryseolinea serpens]|uniref:Putative membrane protein n=1 Tax=Chryseolinea serpens TaxID=947013 RepID=A0A1M5XHN5_9BACT|nr:TPM domain-containing protein [Chryseolinea serpens]SHH99330.1 putative membrane protein [Chryseolinea serpens]